jgi:hypothetical protein
MTRTSGHSSTNVALRTVSEALAKAACQLFEIEAGELMAEFRPVLTPSGKNGLEADCSWQSSGGQCAKKRATDGGIHIHVPAAHGCLLGLPAVWMSDGVVAHP